MNIYYKCNHFIKTTKLWNPLAISAVILSISGLMILITIYIINCFKIFSYGVVIDAGSTSSKVYLYSWPSNKFVYNADVDQIASCKTKTGISNYEDNPNLSFHAIKNCLDRFIIPNIPQDKKASSYIYLGATGGMRMLSYKNPNATEIILDVLRKSLLIYALKINNTMTDISVIPGFVEGITGWITINYLLKNFRKTQYISKPLLGALDMGGASTQVTFLDSTTSDSSDLFNLSLYGKPYRVYSHSYLCYGKSQAELRFLSVLLQKNSFSFKNNNPCMFLGEKVTFSFSEIFFKPCVLGKFAIENYGYEIIPPKLIDKKANFTFIGSSNFSHCKDIIQSLFNNSMCNGKPLCTFNGVYQPKLSGKFGAFSAYPLIKYKLNSKNENFSLIQYRKHLENMCNQKNKSMETKEDKYAKWLCFDLIFLIEILTKIGFNDSNWNDIDFFTKIKSSNVGWSLGYMIEKTAVISKEKYLVPIEDYLFWILLVISILILLFGTAGIVLSIKNKNKNAGRNNVQYDIERENLLKSAD